MDGRADGRTYPEGIQVDMDAAPSDLDTSLVVAANGVAASMLVLDKETEDASASTECGSADESPHVFGM